MTNPNNEYCREAGCLEAEISGLSFALETV